MDFITISEALLLALTIMASFFLLTKTCKNINLPPGPAPLPILGNLHQVGNDPHQSFTELAKVHGPIMCLKLGQMTTIIISSSIIAKEVLQTQGSTFSSRHEPNALHAYQHYQFSILWLPVSRQWRNLRKLININMFSVSQLDASQHLRSKKVNELINYCRECSKLGIAVDIGVAAFSTTLNTLSNTLFSKDLTDPCQASCKEFKDLVWDIFVEAGKPNLVDFFPMLKKIDPQGIRGNMASYLEKALNLLDGLIKDRLEAIGNNDLLDVCLNVAQENSDVIDRAHMRALFLDLFVGGTDTTSNTLQWAMAEALRNPRTMSRAKMEIEALIGKEKTVQESDIPDLPYLRCMVNETLRIHPPIPLIPRKAVTEAQVFGYTVPKDAQVIINVGAIGRDATQWEDPLFYKPERFYDSKMDVKGLDFEVIPFGAGRRICPGIALAMRTVPVMLGSLLNSFDWKLEGGARPEDIDMGEEFGATLKMAHPLRAIPISI